ncbi:MAG TPA: response regulator transcription factor, partial [Verrucomicrobiae bacterium]|nr:response regulator transcription factor [Verrucomicrobiae bacterium]
DGPAGFELVGSWAPDIVILDVVLPSIDGIALLPLLRRRTQAPIVMLTARSGTRDRVAALEEGADLYLGKPFEIPELIALLRSALRRPTLGDPEFLTLGDLVLNLRRRTAEREGTRIELTRREFDLLCVLVREPRRVFSREELLAAIWSGRYVTAGVVDTFMSSLRAKIDAPFGKPLIHTLRGVGFTARAE